ncbi:MAG: hypothetical protein ABL957_01330 [Parvularculaceae bacterium]
MRGKTVSSHITFLRPFRLKGLKGAQPSGTYSVETRDRPVWSFPFFWNFETHTSIRVCVNGGLAGVLHNLEVCPRELFAVMLRDRQPLAA